MEEIEIKIEYNDTCDRDPLEHCAQPVYHTPYPSQNACDTDNARRPPHNDDEIVPSPATSLCPHSPPRIPTPPIVTPSAPQDNEVNTTGGQRSAMYNKQALWYQRMDEYGRILCNYCDLSYSVLQTLKVHVKKKHPNVAAMIKTKTDKTRRLQDLQCYSCMEIFPNLEQFQNHVNCKLKLDDGKLICDYCRSVYQSKEEVINHIREKHTDGRVSKVDEREDIRKFQCPYCSHSAKRRYGLTTHIRARHRTEADLKFSCPFCTHRTSIKYYLQNHIASKHPESDYAKSKTKHVCDDCGYETTKKSHYQQHRKKHLFADKKHKCDRCAYETDFIGNLNVHRRIHTQEKPYSCDYEGCDYKCSAKTALRCHKIKHNPDSHAWYCDKCSYKTVYKNSLKKHMDMHYRNWRMQFIVKP